MAVLTLKKHILRFSNSNPSQMRNACHTWHNLANSINGLHGICQIEEKSDLFSILGRQEPVPVRLTIESIQKLHRRASEHSEFPVTQSISVSN